MFMNNQQLPLPDNGIGYNRIEDEETLKLPRPPLPPSGATTRSRTHFWQERSFEAGLIVSMALYYLFCNKNLQFGILPHQNPLFSLPLLLIFAVLCWYRLSMALALLPLTLPYYLSGFQKVVIGKEAFSLVEVTLVTCILVAVLRLLLLREDRSLWVGLHKKIGPFLLPILVFCLAAALSSVLAISRKAALYALFEEVIGPLLYLVLVLVYLRKPADIQRLLFAFIGTGIVITVLGLAQYYIFKLPVDPEGSRVHAVYGSGNNIGTLFDYILPLLLAIVMGRVTWRFRLVVFLICVPMLYVLYLSQSRGAWIALACATVFIAACSIRNRRVTLAGGAVLALVLLAGLVLFHNSLFAILEKGHVSSQGQSTIMKRPYLWLTAIHMIEDRPWLGYGMDNWLCYYSNNPICQPPVKHYWVIQDPITHKATGLKDEPTLSHPHNIFLHVWVSTGIFGFLAFVVVLVLFYRLFGRILAHVCASGKGKEREQLHWMLVGLGGALCAAIIQGQVDSSFLEQDLAFCFWTIVAALLVLRTLAMVEWRKQSGPHKEKTSASMKYLTSEARTAS